MKYLAFVSLTLLASSAFASGGGGFGGGYSSGGQAPRPVDQIYEAGKNIYTGRSEAYGKLKICVVDAKSSEKVKIKGRTVKPYKGKSIVDFANNLYDCNMPEQQIVSKLSRRDMNLVLYYLNKRYRLKLNS